MNVHPLLFEPIYKPKIWGGQKILKHFKRPPTGQDQIGESWELADLEEDASSVSVGPARGRTLTQLVETWGRELLGDVGLFEGRFPLLIKFLDARESLSVQVHPTAEVARKLGGNVRVKHEAWYVLEAEPGGVIYHGLESGLTAERFRDAMLTGQVEGVLRKVPVRAGECYYLPSGTAHALGEGVLVAEVQTPSDITYRTYDWGRIDPSNGHPRELHLDQAIECIDFDTPSPPPMQQRVEREHDGMPLTQLVSCESFVIEEGRIPAGPSRKWSVGQMGVWIVLQGRGLIRWDGADQPISFGQGDIVLFPAALAEAQVEFTEDVRWLNVTVPV
jgi:mannose-6-phosphate isomerase